MSKKPLILITRPEHQASLLETKLQQAHFTTLCFPCTRIIKLQYKTPPLSKEDIVIFTSQNATQLYENKANPLTIAIGPGTQAALKEKNISTLIPTHFNSEGLLALPALHAVKDKKIVIFCGENPKPLLSQTLKKRGAQVQLIYGYRRTLPQYRAAEIEKISAHIFDFIVVTSRESLNNLNTLFTHQSSWLHQQPLLVISEKMKTLAQNLGFQSEILVSENASDDAIMECLHERMKNK